MTLAALAVALDCRLEGDGAVEIVGVSDLAHAQPGELSFLGSPRYRSLVAASRASALIVAENESIEGRPLLRTKRPYFAFARALELFHPAVRPVPGIHALAAVAPDAHVAPDAYIGPFVSIGAGAVVGPRTIVQAHVAIGDFASVGSDCVLHAHVSIRERVRIGDRVVIQNGAVVGSDGYGFTTGPDGRHYKVPQVGIVVVEDDVEIGANTTIDRAAVGETRIGSGSKIDNLVQIGHNVVLGRDVLLAAQVGISGSTTLEDRVTLGGQVGVQGHITIGRGAIAAGQSGVTNSVEPGRFITGYPAIDNRQWRKASVIFSRLPELRQQLVTLEERLAAIEARLANKPPPNEP
jgi:UDP-3-O-[3-hydroxymyristoyl] glucosamine N-acyltransferase